MMMRFNFCTFGCGPQIEEERSQSDRSHCIERNPLDIADTGSWNFTVADIPKQAVAACALSDWQKTLPEAA